MKFKVTNTFHFRLQELQYFSSPIPLHSKGNQNLFKGCNLPFMIIHFKKIAFLRLQIKEKVINLNYKFFVKL
jgi:hypothetical protein